MGCASLLATLGEAVVGSAQALGMTSQAGLDTCFQGVIEMTEVELLQHDSHSNKDGGST